VFAISDAKAAALSLIGNVHRARMSFERAWEVSKRLVNAVERDKGVLTPL